LSFSALFHFFSLAYLYLSIQKLLFMQISTRGIVLRLIKYGDEGSIVDIFTEQGGLVSFLIKATRGKQNRLRMSLFTPLNILELSYEYRPNSTLQKLADVHVSFPFQTIYYHPIKSIIVLFLQEFLFYALRRETKNIELFQYIVYGLMWLDNRAADFANFHLVFLMRLVRFFGFWPNLDNFKSGKLFDIVDSQFTDQVPFHSAYLSSEEASLLPLMLRMNYRTMHLFHFNRMQRARFLEILLTYYRLHIPEFPALKSQDVLHQTLS